jgi:hypothetical protein
MSFDDLVSPAAVFVHEDAPALAMPARPRRGILGSGSATRALGKSGPNAAAKSRQDRSMSQSIAAHFDGQFIVPDEPVQLPVGQALRVHIEVAEATPRFADLLRFASDLPDAPADLSAQHDHSLSG